MNIGTINCFYEVKPDLLNHIFKLIDNVIEELSCCHIRIIGYPIGIPLFDMIDCN